MTGEPPAELCLGIFWLVPDADGTQRLVVDAVPLARAETYGDFLTHPRGHYEVWTQWQRLGAAGLSARGWPLGILWAEYETYPRGRVVLHIPDNVFWIYANRRLQNPAVIAAIKATLGLGHETCVVKSDEHYR